MKTVQFQDFGQLYRAAFAESDPEMKFHLLQEVQKAIHAADRRQQSELSYSANVVKGEGTGAAA